MIYLLNYLNYYFSGILPLFLFLALYRRPHFPLLFPPPPRPLSPLAINYTVVCVCGLYIRVLWLIPVPSFI